MIGHEQVLLSLSHARRSDSSRQRRTRRCVWIPAFAAMTGWTEADAEVCLDPRFRGDDGLDGGGRGRGAEADGGAEAGGGGDGSGSRGEFERR